MSSRVKWLYRNARYGFTLTLPRWWKPYTVIQGEREQSIGRYSAEYVLHAGFSYKGKTYGDVLTILVYRMTVKQWKKAFSDSPLTLLKAHGKRVFAFMLPAELPYAFLDPKTGEYDYKRYRNPIRYMKRMVNDDAAQVARSIRFPGSGRRVSKKRLQPCWTSKAKVSVWMPRR